MGALDMQPMSIVEDDIFSKLLKYREPGYKVPCRATVSSRVSKLYQDLLTQENDMCTLSALINKCLSVNYLNGFELMGLRSVSAEAEPSIGYTAQLRSKLTNNACTLFYSPRVHV